jgi:membrane-bound metal-dependent hydrolase YbcI (DUF457 family)
MDTITHGIVGALAGKAIFAGPDVPAGSGGDPHRNAESSGVARAAITACTLGAIFPDIDVIPARFAQNPLSFLEWHRNITHSLVMLPAWALLLAAVFGPLGRWLGWKLPSFWKRVLIFGFALGTHIVLDLSTNYGTMVWSPVNESRVAWDWLFIIDFTFTAIALVPQLAAWCYREPGKFSRRAGLTWAFLTAGAFGVYALADAAGYGFPRWYVGLASALMAAVIFMPAMENTGFRWRRASWCRVGFAGLCAYMAAAALAHHQALAYVENYAATHHLKVENLAALPMPPTLTHWSGLIATGRGVRRITFEVPNPRVEYDVLFSSEEVDPYVAEAKKMPQVRTYLLFARFPLWEVQRRDGRTVVAVTDVRFFRGERGGVQRPGRITGGTFTFAVVFDHTGRVVSSGFLSSD